ncbi:unnamed protein product [Boreogadus saida]
MKQKRDVGESHRSCSRSLFLHPASMSDKPRVYQGVRVKTTVKELLQRHRARAADDKDPAVSQGCLDIPSLCVGLSSLQNDRERGVGVVAVTSSYQDHYVDTSVLQADAEYSVQLTGSDGYYQQHQYVDGVVLPTADRYGADIGGHLPLLTPSTFPLPGAQLSPEADYYNGMAASSSPDSVQISSPVEHNSYSPQHSSYSSSSSSSYDSPTRVEPGYQGFPALDHSNYQHCSFADCYCQMQAHCWPAPQESLWAAAESASYYGPAGPATGTTDYPYPAEQHCLKRGWPVMSSDMCYNIL